MSDTKELTYSDVSEHTSKKDLYVVIHDKIYNASSFVDEHPYVSILLHGLCLLAISEDPCQVSNSDWETC